MDDRLKKAVRERDNHRCRWCGATNRGVDAHHIRYRRGYADDVIENLISLCRACHSFVHGIPRPSGQSIVKSVAQQILFELTVSPGLTGTSLWRRRKRQWALEGKCEKHGEKKDECPDCLWENRNAATEGESE